MAYINFENRSNIVVLSAFEAAAFVNEYERLHNEEAFENYKYDDALMYGCQIGCILPLDDSVFKSWHIEFTGNIHRYNLEYLTKHPNGELYFVKINEGTTRALMMFDQTWRAYRTYTLYYELEA